MPPAHPDAALDLHGYHQIRPGEIEAPLALGVEAVLGDWLGQFKAAKDVGEGHAWGGVVKAVLPLGASLITTLGIMTRDLRDVGHDVGVGVAERVGGALHGEAFSRVVVSGVIIFKAFLCFADFEECVPDGRRKTYRPNKAMHAIRTLGAFHGFGSLLWSAHVNSQQYPSCR